MRHSKDLADIGLETVEIYSMLQKGDSLVVGVSGGADSVALLHFLYGLSRKWELQLTAAHLNHCLRGAESDRDEAFVRSLCERLGIPLERKRLEVGTLARERGLSVEECARSERYAFFRDVTPSASCKIATAHTLDDSAETVLLNLARGTALRGLCGIPPIREAIVRPLIRCTRDQVEAYCQQQGLSYITDSTNLSDVYTRNKLRHRVLPVLREINPALLEKVGGMTEALRADSDYLDHLASRLLRDARVDPHRLRADLLRAAPPPLRMRALSALLDERGIPVDRKRLDELDGMLRTGGQTQLSGRWYVRCEGDLFSFLPTEKPPPTHMDSIRLSAPFSSRMIRVNGSKTLTVTVLEWEKYKKSINNQKNQFKNALDCDKIDGIAELRQRRPGDRIRLAGRGCTKTLKKLCQEAGIPPAQRERLLVLADEDGAPLWVEGFGAAQSVCAGDGTRRAMLLEIQQLV